MQNRQFPGSYGRYQTQSAPEQRAFRSAAPVYYTETGGWQGQQRQGQTPVRRRPTQKVYLNRSQKRRLIVILLIVCVLAAGGYMLYRQQQRTKYKELLPYENVYLPNVSVDGIALSGKTRQEAQALVMTAVQQRQNSWSLNLNYEGHTFITLNQALLGITTDLGEVQKVLDEAYAYGHTGGMEERLQALQTANEKDLAYFTAQSDMTDEYLDSAVDQIAAYFEKPAVNAYLAGFDPDAEDPFTIVDDIPGTHLDSAVLKRQVLAMAARGEGGDFEIQPELIPASVTSSAIRSTVTLRGEGVTKIATTSPEGRNSNIAQSMNYINGCMLRPGETFSFNKVVGERTESRGFVEAIEYVYGAEVPGVGGGVCQASTTVYLAALLSGLEVTERNPHSMKVSYTELGQDATVSGNRLDLKFRNNTNGVLYITAHMTYQPKTTKRYQCVVRIYGPTLGENVNYALRSEILDVLMPDEPIIKTDTEGLYVTYDDEMYQYQTARDGYKIATYLQRLENSEVVSEQKLSTDTYRSAPDAYYVGAKSRDEEYDNY